MNREKPDVSFTRMCCIGECGSQPDIPLLSLATVTQRVMSGFYLHGLLCCCVAEASAFVSYYRSFYGCVRDERLLKMQ